jgi:hypothetical protein
VLTFDEPVNGLDPVRSAPDSRGAATALEDDD